MTLSQLDIKSLRNELNDKIAIMDGITSEFTVDGENVGVTPTQKKNFQDALGRAEELKGIIEPAEQALALKSWADAPVGGGVATETAAQLAEFMREATMEAKSLGEMFTDSDEFKALVKSGSLNMQTPWTIETADLGGYGQKDVFTGSAPALTNRGFGRVQRDAMVPRASRMSRVRDLFPNASTDANLIEYFRVIGFGANRLDLTSGARPVADRTAADGISAATGGATDVFGLKPKSNLRFESAQAPVRTVAHYEVAHRNVLDDEPQLQATINNELLYGLRLEEDKQILLGDGTGENLLGILQTPNIQAYTQGSMGNTGESKADALRRAATRAVLAYYPPSGYVIHPYDWEDIELTKATGDGQYVMATNVAVGADTRAWRQPVIESPAMPEGTFLTGAWGLGAQLYDRQQANIRIADQHADFFIRNAVAILAEMRLALAVKRPESFVKGTFIS